MDLIVGSLHFLTQFISFHRLYFLLVILLILSLKKTYFVFLTIFLNLFQSSKLQHCWYLLISLQQSLFHYTLECLVMLTSLEYLNQVLSILIASVWMMFSRALILWIENVSIHLIIFVSFLIKWISSLLFLMRNYFFVGICLLEIEMLTVIGVWSEVNLQLEWMW